VPVPEALGYCADPAVTGAAFYLMSHVDGHPLYTADDTARWLPAEADRRALGHHFVDVLAELHALDPDALGLGHLGRKDSYVGRQLKTWYRSWTASAGPADYDDPRAHSLQAFFLEHLPEQEPAKIVHGDFGVHNVLVGKGGRIAAVVDWEISTLGDPLADLAYALNPWPEPGDEAGVGRASLNLPGFPTRSELAARYAERTGRDLSRLDYYVGFNRWKSACIVHGVYARYMEGKKSTEGVDLQGLRASIDQSLRLAQAAVRRL
jgi:aminoglycoside phosphotransferase (APT) family kinase protein